MVTVRVLSKNSHKPVKGKKVALGIDALFSGGITKGRWSDSNGEARFDVQPNHGKVFVDGTTRYEGYLSNVITVSV